MQLSRKCIKAVGMILQQNHLRASTPCKNQKKVGQLDRACESKVDRPQCITFLTSYKTHIDTDNEELRDNKALR